MKKTTATILTKAATGATDKDLYAAIVTALAIALYTAVLTGVLSKLH